MSRRESADPKKALILTDLEGITGVDTIDAIPSDSPLYRDACIALMEDTNVAAAALFDAGAEEVYVLDGHGGGNNFIKEMLDPRTRQVTIAELPKVIKDISAVVLIGMHAMSGTYKAFLDHTQSSAFIHNYFYNGERIGELSQAGTFAGHFGVPCVAVSGDSAVCCEALRVFPGIYTAEVKHAERRNTATSLPKSEAHSLIYKACREGFLHRASIEPMSVSLPLTVDVEFNRADAADSAVEKHPELTRIDARTVRSVKERIETYFDVLIMWG